MDLSVSLEFIDFDDFLFICFGDSLMVDKSLLIK